MKRNNSVLKITLIACAACLLVCSIVGGSIAWLMAKTDSVVNVFTYGDINISLDETTGKFYKMMPGKTLPKNPALTVKGGSEDCWVFVKIEESQVADLKEYITYTVDDAVWTPLTGVPGVYYLSYSASDTDQVYNIIKGQTVKVNDDVTKEMIDELKNLGADKYPKLTFTGYAVQRDEKIDAINSPEKAWALIGN